MTIIAAFATNINNTTMIKVVYSFKPCKTTSRPKFVGDNHSIGADGNYIY